MASGPNNKVVRLFVEFMVNTVKNVSFIVGHSTESDRDRVQFYLGAGSAGATGTGDDTLFQLLPSNTVVRPSVSGGVYSIMRLGTNSLLDINVFGRRAGIAAAEYANGAEFVELDGIGHGPQLDVPLETAELILGWTAG